MPFTLSTPVTTRDGRKARIICVDARTKDGAPKLSLVALIDSGQGYETVFSYYADGYAFDRGKESAIDLVVAENKTETEVMPVEAAPITPVTQEILLPLRSGPVPEKKEIKLAERYDPYKEDGLHESPNS